MGKKFKAKNWYHPVLVKIVDKLELTYFAGGNAKWYSYSQKQFSSVFYWVKYIRTTFLLNLQSLFLSYPHPQLVFYLDYTDISKASVIVPLLFLYSTFLYCAFYPGNLIYIYDFNKHPITDKSQFYIIIFDLFYSFRSTYLKISWMYQMDQSCLKLNMSRSSFLLS